MMISFDLFLNSYKIREDIRNSWLTSGVDDTGDELFNGNSDTGGHSFSKWLAAHVGLPPCQHIPEAWIKKL